MPCQQATQETSLLTRTGSDESMRVTAKKRMAQVSFGVYAGLFWCICRALRLLLCSRRSLSLVVSVSVCGNPHELAPRTSAQLPRIYITEEDFRDMTEDGLLCSADGTLTRAQFDRMMRMQIKLYVQRQASCALVGEEAGGSKAVSIFQVDFVVCCGRRRRRWWWWW